MPLVPDKHNQHRNQAISVESVGHSHAKGQHRQKLSISVSFGT